MLSTNHYEASMAFARDALQTDFQLALFFLEEIIEKGQGYDLAIQTALKGMEMHDIQSLRLFKALFKKGQGYGEAIACSISKNGEQEF
jgi:hypothetical protein